MNATNWVVGTGVVVTAGRWSSGEPLTINFAIGVGVFSIALALLANASGDLANKYAIAVFIGACFRYLPALVEKLGLAGGK